MFKPGDVIYCVDPGRNALTLRQHYTVVDADRWMVEIQDDAGIIQPFYNWRFKPLVESNWVDAETFSKE